jgi:hypothetical protein
MFHTSPPILGAQATCISTKPITFENGIRSTRFLRFLLHRCSLTPSQRLFHELYGVTSSKTDTSHSINSSQPSMGQRTVTTNVKSSSETLPLLSLTASLPGNHFYLRQIGLGCTPHGRRQLFESTLTARLSSAAIGTSSPIISEPKGTPLTLYALTRRFGTLTRRPPSISTTEQTTTSHFLRHCTKPRHRRFRSAFRHLRVRLRNAGKWFVTIGTMVIAWIRALTAAGMASVVSAEIITKPETSHHASRSFKLGKEEEAQVVADRAAKAATGPRSLHPSDLKRKSTDTLDPPRYMRGFVWSDSQSNISPSALYTETAPLLLSPPSHLINNPLVQVALHAHRELLCI